MGGTVLKGFRDFITRGNVVDLAVGIVIGAAFSGVVTSFTNSFLQPVVKRISGGGSVAGTVSIGGKQSLDYGAFITSVINFLLVAAALYFFVVYPINKLHELRRRGQVPPPKDPSDEVRLLTEIRDALERNNGSGRHSGRDVPVYPHDAPDDLGRR
jgi:large conductance mechanosensitive channel